MNRCVLAISFALCLAMSATLLLADEEPATEGAPQPDTEAVVDAVAEIDQERLQRCRELIEQLGHPEYARREEAEDALAEMGIDILPELKKAEKHHDLEIQIRASRLTYEVWQRDLDRQLTAFLNFPKETNDISLSGWDRFKSSMGDSKSSRQLFASMQLKERELFLKSSGSDAGFRDAVVDRVTRVQTELRTRRPAKVSYETTAALLFLAADERIDLSDQMMAIVGSLIRYDDFRSKMASGNQAPQMKKLLGYWLSVPDKQGKYYRISIATQQKSGAAIQPALELIEQGGNPSQISYACAYVGMHGGKQHLPRLRRLFDQKNVIYTSRKGDKVVATTQIRDVALMSSILLTKQNMKNYGFHGTVPRTTSLYLARRNGFESEAQRNVAFKKWDAWLEKNDEK